MSHARDAAMDIMEDNTDYFSPEENMLTISESIDRAGKVIARVRQILR